MPSHFLHLVVRNLPRDTNKQDVYNHIQTLNHTNCVPTVYDVIQDRDSFTCSTTVSFEIPGNNRAKSEDEIKKCLNHQPFQALSQYRIWLDSDFYGLTTLSDEQDSTIDICFLHGLGGHAFQSWTYEGAGYAAHMWPRDFLPKRLREEGIKARILTYGHNANVVKKANPQATITSAAQELLNHLIADRTKNPNRPIYFVCHSLGGLIVCEALVSCLCTDQDYRVKDEYSHLFSGSEGCLAKGIVFFGTPFRGSKQANYAYPFVKLLAEQCFWPISKDIVRSLEKKSIALSQIVPRFDRIRKSYSIPLLICYETYPVLGTSLTTDKDSALAVFDSDVAPIQINSDHRNMIKFSHERDSTYSTIESRIVAMVSSKSSTNDSRLDQFDNITRRSTLTTSPDLATQFGGLRVNAPVLPSRPLSYFSQEPKSRQNTWPAEAESSQKQYLGFIAQDTLASLNLDSKKFETLRMFDTVFVIDDSGSMQKNINSKDERSISRWDSMKLGLKTFATIAAAFDDDGIDIYLLKNKKKKKDLKDADTVLRLLGLIRLEDPISGGGTKFTQQLAEIIEPRIQAFKDYKNRPDNYYSLHPKPLNLIVLTDGEADDEDALKSYIVQTAKTLEKLATPRNYVGIQFVQVGDDVEAAAYLQFLDDDLKHAYKNDVGQPIWDIVDASRYKYEEDEGEKDVDFEKILMGAVDGLLDKRGSTVVTDEATSPLLGGQKEEWD